MLTSLLGFQLSDFATSLSPQKEVNPGQSQDTPTEDDSTDDPVERLALLLVSLELVEGVNAVFAAYFRGPSAVVTENGMDQPVDSPLIVATRPRHRRIPDNRLHYFRLIQKDHFQPINLGE